MEKIRLPGDHQGQRPRCRCGRCGAELYTAEGAVQRDGVLLCAACARPQPAGRKRRGNYYGEDPAQVRRCLNLLEQYRNGCPMEPRQEQLAQALSRALSGTERLLLKHYYNDAMTQQEIARRTGRSQSGVCRRLKQGERKLRQISAFFAQRV